MNPEVSSPRNAITSVFIPEVEGHVGLFLSGHVHHEHLVADAATILGWQRSLVFEDDRLCFFMVTISPTEVLARPARPYMGRERGEPRVRSGWGRRG